MLSPISHQVFRLNKILLETRDAHSLYATRAHRPHTGASAIKPSQLAACSPPALRLANYNSSDWDVHPQAEKLTVHAQHLPHPDEFSMARPTRYMRGRHALPVVQNTQQSRRVWNRVSTLQGRRGGRGGGRSQDLHRSKKPPLCILRENIQARLRHNHIYYKRTGQRSNHGRRTHAHNAMMAYSARRAMCELIFA